MTPGQCFAARIVLGWSPENLAERAGLKARGVGRFENGEDMAPWLRRRIESALAEAGISFVENWGVTYREKPAGSLTRLPGQEVQAISIGTALTSR